MKNSFDFTGVVKMVKSVKAKKNKKHNNAAKDFLLWKSQLDPKKIRAEMFKISENHIKKTETLVETQASQASNTTQMETAKSIKRVEEQILQVVKRFKGQKLKASKNVTWRVRITPGTPPSVKLVKYKFNSTKFEVGESKGELTPEKTLLQRIIRTRKIESYYEEMSKRRLIRFRLKIRKDARDRIEAPRRGMTALKQAREQSVIVDNRLPTEKIEEKKLQIEEENN
jgi:hypothetical protein